MFKMSYAPRKIWTKIPSLGISMHARAWFTHEDDGYRIPVILIHGLALSSRYMVPLGRRLAALGHDVLAPDLPGFGRSPAPRMSEWPAGPDVREQSNHLLAWMDANDIQKAVLCGNSVGVQVAVEIAARFPDRVDRLILIAPTPDPAYRTPGRQYARLVMNMPFETPSVNPLMHVEYLSNGLPRMIQQLRRTVDDPIENRLPHVQAPTLVIRGQYDKTLGQQWAEKFTSLLPHGKLVVVDGAAHNVHYTAAPLMSRLLHRFLLGGFDTRATDMSNEIVESGMDQGRDPMAPAKLLSPRLHGLLDYASAGLCLALAGSSQWGPRTRQVFAAAGITTATYSLLTNYEYGLVRKLPLSVHLNIDTCSGLKLLLAAAALLRGEPVAGRWAVAAQGAFNLLAVAATRVPMGPARLVPVNSLHLSPPMDYHAHQDYQDMLSR
jgi:pimeloyl-ACP methyl ester carboxylesterase